MLILIWLAGLAAGTVGGPVYAEEPMDDSSVAMSNAAADTTRPDLAILPIANYCQKSEALDVLTPLLHLNLRNKGINFISSDELRPLLRRHRIRSRGWVGLDDARTLAGETGVRYLLLVSYDIFESNAVPEIGVSLRVLDLASMTLVQSVSVGNSGADFTQVLGLGTVKSVEALGMKVIEQACEELFPLPGAIEPLPSHRGCYQLALIPFDNYSGIANGGDILTNIVLSRLMANGYFVVEPGFVRELGLSLEVSNIGGIDRRTAVAVEENFSSCRVVTGTVEVLSPAKGDPGITYPKFAMGIRVMSPQDGNIYMMEEIEGTGNEDDGMFQLGRVHALVPLINGKLEAFLKELAENNREDILYGIHRP